MRLALLLLVLGVLANDHYAALTFDNLALFADGLYTRSDFHGRSPFSRLKLFRGHGFPVRRHFRKRENAVVIVSFYLSR